MRRTLIIAEAGVNHNGDIKLACQLIDAAAEAGADYVKFQSFNTDQLVTQTAIKAEYQTEISDSSVFQYEMLKKLELTKEMHEHLIAYCKQTNIGFLSTGFDIESVKYLAELGIERFKIPSGEITNLPYLKQIGQYNKPIILSTGMATLGEIENALEILQQSGTSLDKITVLHCHTEYPTAMEDVNLMAMKTIENAFGVAVGYSDHTKGIEIPIAAVALGAWVIEKHLTMNCELPGPDHKASIEPLEFKAMVKAIRNIEQALGDGRKKPTLKEKKNKIAARKSLVAATFIRAGEAFTPDNLTSKRPGIGMSPMCWDDIIGRMAWRDFAINELIELSESVPNAR